MIDALQQDPSLIQITIIILLLVLVAIWRQLNKAAMAMAGIYMVYIVFIIISAPSSAVQPVEEDQVSTSEPLLMYKDETLEIQNDKDLGTEVESLEYKSEIMGDSEEKKLTPENEDLSEDDPVVEMETFESQIQLENVVKREGSNDLISVVSMAFGRDLINRELIDVDSVFYLSDNRIYTLTKIRNRNDMKVFFHKWYHEGKLRSKIRMEVGRSYNWRTWSYIDVRPNIGGNWEVFVSDSLGVNYDSLSFQVKAPSIE